MLPSPGGPEQMFTPIHHPEIDQQILEHAFQSQQQTHQPQGMPHLTPYGSLATGTGMQQTPMKTHTYAPSYAPSTPQQLMQPQTPVSKY